MFPVDAFRSTLGKAVAIFRQFQGAIPGSADLGVDLFPGVVVIDSS